MTRPRFRTIPTGALALLCGCASFACTSAPSFRGSPESTGVVVVEPDITFYADVLGTAYGERLLGGAIASADDAKKVVSGGPTSGLVVFSNLKPGKWRLALIEGQLQPRITLPPEYTRFRRHYEVPLESAGAFTFDVRAGEAVYAGAGIVDDARADSRGVRWSRHDDPAAEQKAWKRMEELYGTTDWGPVFRAKSNPQSPRK